MGNSVPNEYKSIKSFRDMPDSYFNTGRKVRVINNLPYVKYVQSSSGGWDEKMTECINQICTVVKVDFDKGIEICTPSKKKWLFSRAALQPENDNEYNLSFYSLTPPIRKTNVGKFRRTQSRPKNATECVKTLDSLSDVIGQKHKHDVKSTGTLDKKTIDTQEFKIGDILRVSSDEKLVEKKQESCGGFSKIRMKDLIGKTVQVKYCCSTFVKVLKDGREYDLHPDILDYPKPETEVPIEITGENDKEIETKEKVTLLFSAIEQNDLLKIFENLNMDILNSQIDDGRTPINIACCQGKTDIVNLLLEFGADLSIPDNYGNLPVHNCLIFGQYIILKTLLEKFPENIDAKTADGKTLYDLSKEQNIPELERFFESTKIKGTIDKTIRPISLPEIPSFSLTPGQNDDVIHTINTDHVVPANGNSRFTLNTVQLNTIKMPVAAEQVQQLKTNLPAVQNECNICFNAERNVAFIKCGHLACRACSERLLKCHICNAEIDGKMVVYV